MQPMRERPVEVLLVDGDGDLAEMIGHCLRDAMPARMTHVTTARDALREELTARHDVMLIAADLPDGDGLSLLRQLRVSNRAPAILTAGALTAEQTLEALRLGVVEVFARPFDMARLAQTVREVGERRIRARRRHSRYRRLRKLTARIIRERRDLRQRMDLICRDFVYAYRRLAQRVADADLTARKKIAP